MTENEKKLIDRALAFVQAIDATRDADRTGDPVAIAEANLGAARTMQPFVFAACDVRDERATA